MSLYNSIVSYQLIVRFNNMISITIIIIYLQSVYTNKWCNNVLSLHIID